MKSRLVPPFSRERDLLLNDGRSHSVVWFVDYTSRTTRRVRDIVRRSVERFSDHDLALSVRFFPDPRKGEPARLAASAAIAASRQGRFPAMHDALFRADAPFSRQSLTEIADKIGLDRNRFLKDLDSEATAKRLEEDIRSANRSTSFPERPMMFIDGLLFEGPWDDAVILEAIQRPLGVRLHLASQAFFDWTLSAGLVLLVATIAALLVVNLGFAEPYEHLRETIAGLRFGDWLFEMPLEMWVNDGLMSLFFLIVGIEIKREILDGELSTPAKAALPLFGAIGGMLVPAAIYLAFNHGLPTANGFGVPMATDIAFTLGIMALLGSRVPTSLKVFVSALAIADDLGAILVIALFYSHGFDLHAFLVAGAILAVMFGLNFSRVYARTPYMILAVFLWYFIHESGLHATLTGVLTAIAIPSRPAAHTEGAALQVQRIFDYERARESSTARATSIFRLQAIVDRLRDPGFHLQHALERWSNFLILPVFAFFNTGIVLSGADFSVRHPEVAGTMLGLLLGKPLGILLTVYLAVRLGWARVSSEVNWTQILGAATLCGIGFTMSIFIASAAFDAEHIQSVKLAVLLSSVIAAVLGVLLLHVGTVSPADGAEDEGGQAAPAR